MMTLVFFLEEPSAREALKGILPRIIPTEDIDCKFVVFQGKQDLQKQLKRKLRSWMKPNSRFVVLRDQDSHDCHIVKKNLKTICKEAQRPETLIRIACHELESWFLGDLKAVEEAFGVRGLADKQDKSKYRKPDRLNNAAQELSRITQMKYQKVAGSRAIGQLMDIENNKSRSFKVFRDGVLNLIG